MFSGRCQNTLISFSLGGHTSARGLPARMAGADRMTCVIYQTRGARPQEKNRPPRDKAPRELSSTRSEGSVSWDRHWQICGDRTHMDTRWHQHTSGGNTHWEALPAQTQTQWSHTISELRCGFISSFISACVLKKEKQKIYIYIFWIFNMLALDLQTHIPTHTPTYMFPLQPEKPQPKLLLLPAAGLSVCPSFLMNGHWLPKGTLLLGNAAPSPSFHIHATAYSQYPSSLLHYVSLLFVPSLSSSLSLSWSPSAPVYSFHSLFICLHKPNLFSLPDASWQPSVSLPHTRTHTHTHLTSWHADKYANMYAQMHVALFSLFIHLLCLYYTHGSYYLTPLWGQLCSHIPSVLPLSSTPSNPQNPPINITEDGCVFIAEIDCGYRVMVPFMCACASVCVCMCACVCVSVRWRALWEAALGAEMWGRQAFLSFPEPSSR